MFEGLASVYGWFNNETGEWGTVGSNYNGNVVSYFVRDHGDWWHIGIAGYNLASFEATFYLFNTDSNGSTTRSSSHSNIYKELQIEAGYGPSSFILTEGSPVTRAADADLAFPAAALPTAGAMPPEESFAVDGFVS